MSAQIKEMFDTTATDAILNPDYQIPRSMREIKTDLSKPVAARHLKHKSKGGQQLAYIPWYYAIKYLDLYAPGWSNEIRSVSGIGGKVIVVVRLLIPSAEGVVWREATGIEDEDCGSYGDPSSNAESMALRRAAAKFGLGLYLYEK
jgi:hypothetical protein